MKQPAVILTYNEPQFVTISALVTRDKYSKIEAIKLAPEDALSLTNNKVYPYEVPYIIERDSSEPDERIRENTIVPNNFADLERESSLIDIDGAKVIPAQKPAAPKPAAKAADTKVSAVHSSTLDKAKSIAFNSREVRLVGPDMKEVEMKDDVATKVVVALENIQKDATELWGQVNEKLDKGWTDLKAMVEKAIAPPNNDKSSPATSSRKLREAANALGKSNLVVVSDTDGYSLADNDSPSQAESAATKVKGFLSNIGLNEDNQKKASAALSNAGTAISETVNKDIPDALKKAGDAVSETVRKDLPDALKKAGDAVSDTVTKDIPNAFKELFG